ncbi:MAG: hypothetical protein Fur0046_36250 [Cyanobacteria bacterium J069]|nr:MAG: hypothetical protein D6742_12600 [Cyanobacteria bacterium J069]
MDEPTPPTVYRMSLLEGGAIALGGLLVIVGGIIGLGDKAVRNATDPARAEAIARSIVDYQIPGQVHGLFGLNLGSVKMGVVTNAPPDASVQPRDSSGQPNTGDRTRVELLVARTPLSSRNRIRHTDGESDFSLLSLPGVSISYEIQGEFQPTSSRDQTGLLCDVTTRLNVEEGTARLADSPRPIPAIRYEASIELDAQNHSVVLMAIGQNARQTARQVFGSLRCR